jgi:hypothetical protein
MSGEDGATSMPSVETASRPMTLDPQDNSAEAGGPEQALHSKRKKHQQASSGGLYHESPAFIVMCCLNMKVLPKKLSQGRQLKGGCLRTMLKKWLVIHQRNMQKGMKW